MEKQQMAFRSIVYAIPSGFIAVEAGWTLTEVGRQPWILQGIMRTSEAVTPMPGIRYTFFLFTAVYFSLALVVIFLLYRQIKMVGKIYDVAEKITFQNELKHAVCCNGLFMGFDSLIPSSGRSRFRCWYSRISFIP